MTISNHRSQLLSIATVFIMMNENIVIVFVSLIVVCIGAYTAYQLDKCERRRLDGWSQTDQPGTD